MLISHIRAILLIIFIEAEKDLLNISREHIASVNDIDICFYHALGLLAREYVRRVHNGEITHGKRVLYNERIEFPRFEHTDTFSVVVEAYCADAVF